MNERLARIADREDDYVRPRVKPGQIEAWEDGMRTSGDRGSYEWGYFDAHLDDGSSMVITFYTKPMLSPKGPEAPMITGDPDRPGQPKKHLMLHATPEQFSASRETCDVRVKNSYFRGDLHRYQIRVVDEGISIDAELVGQVPAWRPGTGHIYFGEHDDHLFAWLPSVPQGSVTVTVTEEGSSRTLTGIGYHDHNWGDVAMAKLLNHWYWGRAQAGPYAIVASYLYAEKAYGHAELPIFMLARDGKVVADASSKVTLRLEDEGADPKSGKPVADRVIYDYKDGQDHYRVTFQRSETILDLRFADMVTGFKHILARMANVDGAYLRFTGQVSVERYVGDGVAEQASDPGIWELMYFGHVE